MKNINNNILIIFLVALILFGLIIRIFCLDKKFTAEEVDFVKASEALRDTGHPVYYASEQIPNEIGLWHPPLYVFFMSFILKFIPNEIGARGINIFFSILCAIMIFLFSYYFFGKNRWIIGLISSAFFLINYYIFSSSMIIDIDVLSAFFIGIFIFSFLANLKTKNNNYIIISGIALFFSIFNRFQIAFLVYVIVGAYLLYKKELDTFKKYFLIGVISLASFIFVWGIYSIFIEPGKFFYFLIRNAALGGESLSNPLVYIFSFILNIAQFIRLVTFPAVFLIIFMYIYFLKRKESIIKIPVISSLGILILFFIIPRPAFGYPRYFLSAFPMIAFLMGIFLYERLKGFKIKKEIIIFGVLAFFVSLTLLILLHPQLTDYSNSGLIKSTNLLDFLFGISATLPILLILFIKKEKSKNLIIILLIIFLSYSIYFDIGLVIHNSHTKDAGEYIESVTTSNDLVIMPKAVGYYTNRKFFANDYYRPPIKKLSLEYFKEYIIKSFYNRKMDDEFFWAGGIYGGVSFLEYNPPQESLKKASYAVLNYRLKNLSFEKKIGDFYIYRLNNQN